MSFYNVKYKSIARLVILLFCVLLITRGFFSKTSLARNYLDPKTIPDFILADMTKKSGIDFIHRQENPEVSALKNVALWLSSQGSSVSVVDINNDNFPDIYLTNTKHQEKNFLYINQKDGTFTDRAEQYGLANLNVNGVTFRSLFFDCDNDGVQEVLILTEACPKFYKLSLKNKKYMQVPFSNDSNACVAAVSASIFDYDRDGNLDIIYSGTTGNGFSKSDNLPRGFVAATNGAPTIVFKNDGQCNFKKANLLDRQKENLFTNAIGVGDFRGTGESDIWFATDFNTDRIYTKVQTEPSKSNLVTYEYSDKTIDHYLAKSGMSVEHTFFPGEEKPHVFVSHVHRKGYYPYGNNLWQYDNDKFVDQAPQKGIQDCDWAWGAKFVDMNNDGFSDLYVSNGFATSETQQTNKDYWYFLGILSSAPRSLSMEANQWPNMTKFNLSGYERDCFFINDKKNNFFDAAEFFNLDSEKLNGRGVASLDIQSNGNMGLVVTNQKNKTYLFQSQQKNKNSWIGFKLVGTRSNRDAVGAKVKVYLNGSAGLPEFLIQEVAPYNGYVSQSDSRLHFGLGESQKDTVSADVIWPSGHVQRIDNMKTNLYHVVAEVVE